MIILDRIEGILAVLETDTGRQEVPLEKLPSHVKEGDVLVPSGTGYAVDSAATQARREKLLARTRKLKK